MQDTAYAFAVARVRSKEPLLLDAGTLEQMIAAVGVEEALRLLGDRGWETQGAADDPGPMLRREAEKLWELLKEAMPQPGELSFLLARNDFHNGKAALKALVAGQEFAPLVLYPHTVGPKELEEAVSTRSFGKLPRDMAKPMEEAYGVLVETMDAQLCDCILDRGALTSTLTRADKTGNPMARRVAEILIVTADLKIALRGARTGKNEAFLLRALCPCYGINTQAMAQAASKGTEEFLSYLGETPYGAAADSVAQSLTAFEKWCDDWLMAELQSAKLKSFGPEPLIAYYLAREAELKTVRILLSCKKLGLGPAEIKERVRRLYV